VDFASPNCDGLPVRLSYREFDLLGRALTPDEAREVSHIARRIAALILLQPELDAKYQRVKADTYEWKS
jgi:hypothetical protein